MFFIWLLADEFEPSIRCACLLRLCMRAGNKIGLAGLANQKGQQIWTDTDGVGESDLVGGWIGVGIVW